MAGNFNDPQILDPNVFAFFKGLNDPAQNGVLTANVAAGLAPGNYRMASINTGANHAPAVAAVAQHGFFDDMIYVRLFSPNENATTDAPCRSSVHCSVDAATPSLVVFARSLLF
jgi:hypothetical protein